MEPIRLFRDKNGRIWTDNNFGEAGEILLALPFREFQEMQAMAADRRSGAAQDLDRDIGKDAPRAVDPDEV